MTASHIVRIHKVGGPDVLVLEELDIPAPGAGEIRIKVSAIGLNRADAFHRQGTYGGTANPLPSGIGFEAAGVVEDVGQGVEHVIAGDAVNILPGVAALPFGTYGERIIAPAEAVVRQPDSLSAAEAAGLWVAHLTAYAPLVEIARVGPGDVVLITAASSGVGLAAIGIVRLLGGLPVALTRGRSKVERLFAAGAGEVIVTSEDDVVARVRTITGGKGARVAFDPVAGPAIETLLDALAVDGVLVTYGALARQPTPLPFSVLAKNLTISGYAMDIGRNPERRARAVEFIGKGVESGALSTIIDSRFSLAEVAAAHTALESNAQVGKIILLT